MRTAILIIICVALGACDMTTDIQYPRAALDNNAAAQPDRLPTGQSHTDCPMGQTMC